MNIQNSPKFTVVSTFSGCGGSSLGYQLAGGKILLAVEWEDNAVKTYRLNFPETPIFHGDIKNLTEVELFNRIKLRPGELDIFDGSPPCQGFSTAGKRKMEDNRNYLFLEYIRLLRALSPKCFVMENVSGMVKGKMKLVFADILSSLKNCGYCVKAAVLNAKNYQVPQSRERIIFLGVRSDYNLEPSFPTPSRNLISAERALYGAPYEETPALTDKYGKLWAQIQPGKSAASILSGAGFNNCNKIDPKKPSPTLPKMQGGHGFGTIVHWKEKRPISISEAKRLQSFPDDFKFFGKYQEQWARIGNSVPPNLMKAIAGHLYSTILVRINKNGH